MKAKEWFQKKLKGFENDPEFIRETKLYCQGEIDAILKEMSFLSLIGSFQVMIISEDGSVDLQHEWKDQKAKEAYDKLGEFLTYYKQLTSNPKSE